MAIIGFVLLFSTLIVNVSAQDGDPYAMLPQTQALEGYPDLGYPSALVNVTIYAAFDDLASGEFWRDSFRSLLPRLQSGEIRVIFVPLFVGGDIPGGRGAARAAICANDQGKFWQYADLLYDWQSQFGDAAFDGERLQSGAEQLDLNNGQWLTCLSGDGPDVILDDAANAANRQSALTTLPYVLVNALPSLPDAESLGFTIDLELRRANDALEAELAVTPEATEDVDRYTFDPLIHEQIEPPLTIDLPDGWGFAYDALVLQDLDGIRPIPFAVYQGPVTGGTGNIVLLWGFPNLVNIGASQPDVWIDGTRLLRLAILESGCNPGTDLRRTYSVGGLQAIGTQWAAVDCPELPDTRGWFAGLRQFNVNFVFYVYTDPITAMDGSAPDELQAILDTVRFIMPEITPEAGG